MPRFRILLLAAVAAAAVLPASASAGTYHVYNCAAGGAVYPNGAWSTTAAAGVVVDNSCAGGQISLSVPAGARMVDNTSAALTFTSPAGTTIADFTLTRQLGFDDPIVAKSHHYFVTYSLGSTYFAGAGNFNDTIKNALNAQKLWYGYPNGPATVAKSAVNVHSFVSLNGYALNANQLALRVGCYSRGTPCSVDTGGSISAILQGSDITINDPTPPVVTVDASGLLAGGAVNGSDPVTVSATDGAGIRRVDLIDVTNPAAPAVVGTQDFAEVRTNANKLCTYSLAAPCPNLNRQPIRPTSLAAGQRQVIVRVTDTGGNVVDRGRYPVFAVTPSDRGALNGVNATDAGTLYVAFTHGSKPHRTVAYGEHVGVRGKLINASGQPIGGARLTLLTEDLRRDAALVPRTALTTRSDGSFSTTVAATASRLLQFAWLSHANDVRFSANGYLTLDARASGRLSVSTRRPRVGHSLTVSGKLRGVSRGGVTVVVQGRPSGSGHYETFADTTTSANGDFRVRYRFRSSGSRGHSFVFRAKIRPAARFPYETGYSNTATVRVR
jgi:hypothetical protein